MKKILVINGANLNMLGIREKDIYGEKSYKDLVRYIKVCAKTSGVKVKVWQSDSEGEIVVRIQKSYGKFDGIVINAGAYTHTSVAILDALKAVNIPTVEVHLSDISRREDFRKVSYISQFAIATVSGKMFEGYKDAIEILLRL